MKKLILIPLLIATLSPAIAAAKQGNGAPPLSWHPLTSINTELESNAQRAFEMTLFAQRDLGPLSIDAVPALAGLVTVEPSTLIDVKAGEQYLIRVVLSAGEISEPSIVDGVIHVRANSDRRNGKGRVFPRPLPITVMLKDSDSIAGVDADGNGIWDYIDRYIADHPLLFQAPDARAAAMQFVVAMQDGLLNAAEKADALRAAEATQRAIECMYSVQPDEAYDLVSSLNAAILNSRSRSLAFVLLNSQVEGEILPALPTSDLASACN